MITGIVKVIGRDWKSVIIGIKLEIVEDESGNCKRCALSDICLENLKELKKMWNKFKQLFCRHEWETRQCFSMFHVWYIARCKKCGKRY